MAWRKLIQWQKLKRMVKHIMMYNIGDIIATIFLLGFFAFIIIVVIAAVKASINRKKQHANESNLKKHIETLELRVEKLEKKQ